MTEQQFDARLQEIDKEYASKREGAEAYRDQEMSRLFVQCGWTQEAIAKHMCKAQSWVARRLHFGRYLRFMPSGHNHKPPPHPLTERRFRDNWARAGKGHPKETEDERFARVQKLIEADNNPIPKNYGNLVRKPGIKQAVIDVISDGKRRTTAEIAELVSEKIPETDASQVIESIKLIRRKPPRGMALDARHSGRTHKYRLVPRKGPSPKPIDPEKAGAVAVEAIPLVKECIHLLRQPEVGRCTSLALEHLWRVGQMLERLLVPEEVA